MFRSILAVSSIFALMSSVLPASAQDAAPADAGSATMTEVRVRKLAGMTVLTDRSTVPMAKLSEAIAASITKASAAAKGAGIAPAGAPVVIITNTRGGGDMTVEAGVPVEPGTVPPDGLQVRDVPAMESATLVFAGPMPAIGGAYQKLYAGLMAMGYRPLDEQRQYLLHWEGPVSPNNVVLLQVGVEK